MKRMCNSKSKPPHYRKNVALKVSMSISHQPLPGVIVWRLVPSRVDVPVSIAEPQLQTLNVIIDEENVQLELQTTVLQKTCHLQCKNEGKPSTAWRNIV